MMINPQFWQSFEQLVANYQIVIDRPKGAAHPRYPDLIYPLDYGNLAGTTAGDGDGIDVWIGTGVGKQVTGIVCTVDIFKRDAEIKVLVDCSKDDIHAISHFLDVMLHLPYMLIERKEQP